MFIDHYSVIIIVIEIMIRFNYEYYCSVLIDEIFIFYLRIEINKEVCYLYIFLVREKQHGKIMLFIHIVYYMEFSWI